MRESSSRTPARGRFRNNHKYFSGIAFIGFLTLLLGSALLAQGDSVRKDAQTAPTPNSVNMVGPGFKVYSLKGVSVSSSANATSISFDASGLPFEFKSLLFSNFQISTKTGATYYAGSGMMLNVSGPDGNITLREQGGKVIRTIQYDGQPSIVFNGESVYTSTPKAYAEYEGTDILVQDWLKGTWSPEKGVILERPTGMTIDNPEFYLMVFQPQATVPEFGAFPLAALMIVIVCAVAARLRKSRNP